MCLLYFYLQIQVDEMEAFSSMPTGYPSHISIGSKDVFGLRFPQFTSSVVYDPTVRLHFGVTGTLV